MIERYTRPAMGRIWGDESKYAAWLRVELAVCEAYARRGRIPPEALARHPRARRGSTGRASRRSWPA